MKKKLYVLFACLLCITSILISGCDDAPQMPYVPTPGSATPSKDTNDSPANPNPFETVEATEPDDGRAIPFSKMKEDMSAREEIQSFYTSDFVTESAYVVTDLELEKEQVSSDGKQTTSYSNIIAQNEYFVSSLRVRSVYNFYDYGGWIMDEFSIEQIHTVSPLRVPNEDSVIAYLKDYGTSISSTDKYDSITEFYPEDNTLTIKSTELVEHSARFYLLVENPVMTLNCYIVFEHKEDGWKKTTCHTESVQYDYSSALGSFRGSYYLSASVGTIEGNGSIQVVSISENKAIINVDYCKVDLDGLVTELVTGQNMECEFFTKSGTIKVQTIDGWDEYLRYYPNDDAWRILNLNLNRTES